MARRKQKRSFKSFLALAIGAGVLTCGCAIAIATGIASTSYATSDEVSVGLGSSSSFQTNITIMGINDAETLASQEAAAQSDDLSDAVLTERVSVTSTAACDMSAGLTSLQDRLDEAARIAAEEARIAEENHIAEVEASKQSYMGVDSLPDVDWSVGKEAFIEEWGQRIDDYLAGSNLAGYGTTFAEAAWEYGVDPRWSPAISNTESGKGANCFLPYNAWGWGSTSWSNWTEAIWAHIKGLADGYGYSISQYAAAKYCPPNSVNWFNNTLSEMLLI